MKYLLPVIILIGCLFISCNTTEHVEDYVWGSSIFNYDYVAYFDIKKITPEGFIVNYLYDSLYFESILPTDSLTYVKTIWHRTRFDDLYLTQLDDGIYHRGYSSDPIEEPELLFLTTDETFAEYHVDFFDCDVIFDRSEIVYNTYYWEDCRCLKYVFIFDDETIVMLFDPDIGLVYVEFADLDGNIEIWEHFPMYYVEYGPILDQFVE